MRVALRALLLLAPISSLAQEDTIHIQTLTYDSITTRRGWWVFPDNTHTFRKVLMHHTLKCDPATTQDIYDCGAWDYLTYNFVHRHTGLLDSTALQHPYFLVGTAAPDSLEMVGSLPFDQHQREQVQRNNLGTISESDHSIGNADATDDQTLGVQQGAARSQFLLTSGQLAGSGLAAGPIEQLRLTAVASGTVDRLIIRMANTLTDTLAAFEESGLIKVFDHDAVFSAGVNTFMLTTPFTWDGISNLLLEIDAENQFPWSGVSLVASDMSAAVGVQDIGRDGVLSVNNDFLGVAPAGFAALNDQVTITFRAYGDASLPQNTTLFEGVDAEGRRVLNVHLPWSDGNVYWDAGNDGGGYDRINKAATTAQQEGQWNDWAFVKNTGSGQMKIYLNGALWHSGTGKTKPMSGIVRFKIASAANGDVPYTGLIEEFNVFSTEVSAATIAEWHARRVDATHPDAADLIYSYHFDELPTEFMETNAADPDQPAWLMGTVQRQYKHAEELGASFIATVIRPDIVFVQGEYTTELDTSIAIDPEVHAFVSKETYHVIGNTAMPLDTTFAWGGGYTYTFDTNGQAIDSSYVAGTWYWNDTLDYYGVPFDVVENWEIGRYITPYGINLDLGPQGFRWTFDVTDYQWLLHDSVELSAGNQQELIDLEFEMIEGTPPRALVHHQQPWGPQRSYGYGGLSDGSQLAPVTVGLDPTAAQWMLGERLTGHGDATSIPDVQGCCEFRDNTHYLDANGTQVDDWHVWQTNDCALNPVYPQGGTWLNSREGWCPGDVVKDHTTELTPYVTGDSITLDYRITPVPGVNPGMAGGNYVVNMDLFEYAAASHALDAEIYAVKRPTDEGYQGRENPICMEPLVTLRNAGGTDLTSVTFTYNVSGGPVETYTWNGLLKHMQSADVALPTGSGWFWSGDGSQNFHVTVSGPNGGTDQYTVNDSYTTHFVLPPIYPETFILNYKTNNRPNETSCTIRNLWGSVVYQQNWGTLGVNTTHYDTLTLTPGCYSMELFDTGNDGIYYWADTGQGSGFFRFKHIGSSVFKNFQREFGRSIHFAFAIADIVGVNDLTGPALVTAVPNPSSGSFMLDVQGMEGPARVEILDVRGSIVQEIAADLQDGSHVALDLGELDNGLYLARVVCEEKIAVVRLMKQ